MKIKLYGRLRSYAQGSPVVEMDVEAETSVQQIIQKLGIPDELVSVVEQDGRPIHKSSRPGNAATITLVPVVSGG
jgi:sulfur carrier protein ThiS